MKGNLASMKLLKSILIFAVFLILFFFASWSIINFFVPLVQEYGFFKAIELFWQSWFDTIKSLFGA